MSLWYRVFAALDTVPDPAGLRAWLAERGLEVRGSFVTDESGWYRAELAGGAAAPVAVERFLAGEQRLIAIAAPEPRGDRSRGHGEWPLVAGARLRWPRRINR